MHMPCVLCYRGSVTAVFNLEDGTEKEFTRIIKMQQQTSSALSLYLVNNEVINLILQQFLSLVLKCIHVVIHV